MANRRQQIDVHELLKRGIGRSHVSAPTQPGSIPRPVAPHIAGPTTNQHRNPGTINFQPNPRRADDHNEEEKWTSDEQKARRGEIGIEDHYFLFDSFEKDDCSDIANGSFVFDLQKIRENFPIKNIVQMEIGIFTVPQIDVESYQVPMFYNRKLYLEVENIAGQQFVHGDDKNKVLRKFHYDLNMETSAELPDRFNVDPSRYQIYTFSIPVRDLQSIKFRFKTPTQNVPFASDVIQAESITSAGPSPANRQIATTSNHGLTIGNTYAIYIKNFNSTNNDLNNFMNNVNGHLLEVISTTVLQFTTAPVIAESIGSAVAPTGGEPSFKIYIAHRRIAIPMRFRSVVGRLTNFINP